MSKHIVELFHDYFEMVPATTEVLKTEAYRLRYQVYCLETGFLDPQDFPDGLEKDEDDEWSEHYLIRHRATGTYAGTARLILPDLGWPERPFPTERLAQLTPAPLWVPPPRAGLAELSRLCVSKSFKRRQGEGGTATGVGIHLQDVQNGREEERRSFPHIMIALLACVMRTSVTHNITHWYGFMEVPLFRLFNWLGISWAPIGQIAEFHGMRQPCILALPDYLAQVKQKNRELWDMLTDYGRFWQGGYDFPREWGQMHDGKRDLFDRWPLRAKTPC
jgi:N-acyl amino acid synthase of PEP-CTERM/exosortase system